MNPNFISNLRRKRCDYNHPDQATSQANSLILLSSGIYTEEERFVFELLQNAVDAHNDSSHALNVKMEIKEGYFIFQHNGDAFTERDIEGLCDVGNGNKMKDAKKIGYKGIGFKSVFMCSTNVTVASGEYCFKFDKSYWDNYWVEHWDIEKYGPKDNEKRYLMPWQIIPIETEPPIKTADTEYTVATYIKVTNTTSLEQKIGKLLTSSQFLLFLKSKNIDLDFFVDDKLACKINKSVQNDQVILSRNGEEESRWLIHTNENVEVPTELREVINADINTPDKLKNVRTFDLSFAIALDNKGKLQRLDNAVIYTYLPTSFRFGFPFLVNANFITDAGRQQLHKDSEWNKLIFAKIPSEFLLWMRNITSSYKNYWEVLPETSYGRENALENIYANEMQKAIGKIPFIPLLSNSQLKILASDAVMDRMGISDAISKEAFISHINRKYNHSFSCENLIANVWKGSRILGDYGVFIFDKKKIKGIFEDDKVFGNIDVSLNSKLIEFLFEYYVENKTEQEELAEILRMTKFLLGTDDKLYAPSELFFPSNYQKDNKYAEDAKILNNDVYNVVNSKKQEKDWLIKLGVQELSDITFIRKVVCEEGYITIDNAIETIRFLYDVNQRTNIFEKIGNYNLSGLMFLSKQGRLESARNLYLGSYYKPVEDIEKVYDEDIYISDDYPPTSNDVEEWSAFLKKLGVKSALRLTNVELTSTKGLSFLEDVRSRFEKEYNVGSRNRFYYHFGHFKLYYAPFILTSECSNSFQRLIWSSILTKEFVFKTDSVEGAAGFWSVSMTFSNLEKENFIDWAFRNVQKFPSVDGQLLPSKELLQNTEDIKSIAGCYLPVLDIEGDVHESWNDLLRLRNIITIDDCLTLLTNVSKDIDNAELNKGRICKVYQKLVEIDALAPNNQGKIMNWASTNLILSKDNKYLPPTELSHITLDGFGSENRVYIGSPSNRGKVIELLSLMGVRIITEESIKPQFENKYETDKLKNILLERISPLALVSAGENPEQEKYDEKKLALQESLKDTHFYHCDKISLTYGNDEDVIDKQTFGSRNEFYYTGDLRPANVEPLLTPLCKYLDIKGKERELFIMMIEDFDGIRQNLGDKGYDVSLLEEPITPDSGTIKTHLDYSANELQQVRNMITGFKGEIIIYERLIALGYTPECPSISTKDDYEKEVVVNGKTYYCKSNYNKWDISFVNEDGNQIFLEVKSTTTSVGSMANMPISFNEWSMIKACDRQQGNSYFIVRVFGIDTPNQDIYLLKGHIWDKEEWIGL